MGFCKYKSGKSAIVKGDEPEDRKRGENRAASNKDFVKE